MCEIGDIIEIKKYKHDPYTLNNHPFIIIDDSNGIIKGLNFNLITVVMSSVKNEEQKQWKLSKYPSNMGVEIEDKNITDPTYENKNGYVKTEQFYYFNKESIEFRLVGSVTPEYLNELYDFIEGLNEKGISIEQITENL
ncbi:hypothetical protein [Clostridium beijerinckii]|uniref:Uncharacterized protein n=1 Tax=Clostridium beijerinckii TaxID=1520 RepID=A0AAE5LSQ9_CLOBE|nr:hypothetical protein [Clostridium beijerinckii]NSB17419.1 hypothetical protein [Clostridium beijerinckii]OOM28469.1 hypothetical protein CLOBE_27250 [Clostridium beijerinckii]